MEARASRAQHARRAVPARHKSRQSCSALAGAPMAPHNNQACRHLERTASPPSRRRSAPRTTHLEPRRGGRGIVGWCCCCCWACAVHASQPRLRGGHAAPGSTAAASSAHLLLGQLGLRPWRATTPHSSRGARSALLPHRDPAGQAKTTTPAGRPQVPAPPTAWMSCKDECTGARAGGGGRQVCQSQSICQGQRDGAGGPVRHHAGGVAHAHGAGGHPPPQDSLGLSGASRPTWPQHDTRDICCPG